MPYVIIIGPTLHQISSAYVAIDENIFLETNDCLKAVDLCIQCVNVFKKSYSRISDHVWTILETLLYQFPQKKGNDIANVLSFIKKQKLNKI